MSALKDAFYFQTHFESYYAEFVFWCSLFRHLVLILHSMVVRLCLFYFILLSFDMANETLTMTRHYAYVFERLYACELEERFFSLHLILGWGTTEDSNIDQNR